MPKIAHRENFCQEFDLLESLGFSIEKDQPYIGGEHFAFSKKKLVLLGRQTNNEKRQVIKISNDPEGAAEILQEHKCRVALKKINSSRFVFFFPEELFFEQKNGYTISATEFIKQENSFLDLPLTKKVSLALKSLQAQETIKIDQYQKDDSVSRAFEIWNAQSYLEAVDRYSYDIDLFLPKDKKTKALFAETRNFFTDNLETVDLFSGFLMHWDFNPNNFRVNKDNLYFLDLSSFRFGNKYESWGRFANFMTLYDRPLENEIAEYVKKNRAQKESLSLKLLRAFRLLELIRHHANIFQKSSGNLAFLSKARVDFWGKALEALMENKILDRQTVEEYKNQRDNLRSEKEKQRQKEIR